MNLGKILKNASTEHWAVGHFNVANLEMLKAAIEAAKDCRAPVMIGTSEGEREWLGLANIVALVGSERKSFPYIYLNADHTKSVEAAFKAVDAGYDSVHFDGSALSLEENIKRTKEVFAYAKSKNSEISVEGELGYLRGESQLTGQKVEVSSDDYTKPEEAAKFVNETGVDRLAVVVGNIHGLNLDEPKLDIERIAAIRQAVPSNVVLVLHAGSGISESDIEKAIEAGIGNIHISTELRVAYREGLEEALKDNPKEYAPYKLYAESVEELEKIIARKIKLFGSAGRCQVS